MNKNNFVYSQSLMEKSEFETFKKINSFKIMEKAAKKSFNYIIQNLKFKKVLVVCGPGNNGGDGILIAKYLNDFNVDVTIYAPNKIGKSKDSKKALEKLKKNNLLINKINLKEYDLIIDCLFGIGFNRPFTTKLCNLINKINNSKNFVISIDLPSGVLADSGMIVNVAIIADITLTFHRLKPGLLLLPGKEYSGEIKILKINLVNLDNQTNIFLLQPPLLNKIKLSDHKYLRGVTYIIAGRNLLGASKLATLAATQASLRSGAGVVKIFVHEKDLFFFRTHILEEMLIPYKSMNQLINIIKKTKISSFIYGCGLDINRSNKVLLYFLLKQSFNIVLDAAFFSLIKKDKKTFFKLLFERKGEKILTPHKGEFEKVFSNKANKIESCIEASKKTKSIILYKGNDTIITTPKGKAFIINKNSPFLATAGSGDVLSGLIGGFLAQKYSGIKATQLGCYVHSECGKRLKRGMIARDLINEIPKVLRKMKTN